MCEDAQILFMFLLCFQNKQNKIISQALKIYQQMEDGKYSLN